MTESPRRPEKPPSDRKGVQGGQIDVSKDLQRTPAAPAREGGMLNQAGEPGPDHRGRDGGMLGEG